MPDRSEDRLLRVSYFSRNAIDLPTADALWEVDRILEAAQANNARTGVTGALLFNDGAFAQVLEGPGPAVEDLFDRIQLDDRHCDVTVLETGWIEERMFPNWSMGFVGQDAAAAALYSGIADRSSFDAQALSASELLQLLVRVASRNEMKLRAA